MYSVSRHLSFISCPKKFFAENLSDDETQISLINENKNSAPLLKHESIRRDIIYIIGDRINPDLTHVTDDISRFCSNFLGQIRSGDQVYFDDIGTYTTFSYFGLDIAGQILICVETDAEVVEYRLKTGGWVDADKDRMHAAVSACWYRSFHDNPQKPFISRFMYLNERFEDQDFRIDYSVDDEYIKEFIENAKQVELTINQSPEFFATPGNNSCRFCPIISVCDEHDNFRHGEVDFPELRLVELPRPPDELMFFLSHHSSIKELIVKPLCRKLEADNLSYWLDREHMFWGRGGIEEMNAALQASRHVIYFLNRAFFESNWARTEFFNRINRDIETGQRTYLPLIVADQEFVRAQAPIISDTLYEHWDNNTLGTLSRKLRRIVEQGI